MSEDLQSLLEKINREGVEKAQAEADRIVADAKAKAAEIVKAANDEAARAKAEADKAAGDYAARAAETVRQVERDTIRKIEAAVTALLEKVLRDDVDRALSDEKTAGALVAEAVRGLVGPVEVAAPAKLVPALKAQLAAKGGVTVVMDDTLGTGFAVTTDGGRVEHAFTGDVVADELAKRLRPDLAALLK
jgi:V/A-type H+-transporting ATPase subunit E